MKAGQLKLVFSIFDEKAAAFGMPFFTVNEAMALRMILATARDQNTNIAQFPGDFTLFVIGEWDEDDGRIEMYPAHKSLGTVLQILAASESPMAEIASELSEVK